MKSLVIASVLLLGVFGCAMLSDTGDDVVESSEAAVSESPAEGELAVCQQYSCRAVKPGTDCHGFGIALSQGRCRADALNDCKAHCGGICVIDSGPTCDFY
jgi:hypothetical protein